MQFSILLFLLLTSIFLLIAILVLVLKIYNSHNGDTDNRLTEEMRNSRRETIEVTTSNMRAMGEMLRSSQETLQKTVNDSLMSIDRGFRGFAAQNEQKLENIRATMENRLNDIRTGNDKQLEEMRKTVDEKLQKTLDDRISQSFKLVSERLEQVYKGLGEMQTLANGVGDLKKVLGNVKTRGILGEIQLGAILEQMLSNEQYSKNIITKSGSRDPVEYAVKMPTEEGGYIYLPIDAKFPLDAYSALTDAYDTGDQSLIEVAASNLVSRIKRFAKDINDKYIDPPFTTEFAIMFLPVEGLYAEVVRRGMVEVLQHDFKVSIAGPTTMSALLNSLQMGFRSLAIQKRTSEVWNVLGAVKTEFEKFNDVLLMTQQRINQANDELDKLVGVRTRQIQRRLKNVTKLEDSEARYSLSDYDE